MSRAVVASLMSRKLLVIYSYFRKIIFSSRRGAKRLVNVQSRAVTDELVARDEDREKESAVKVLF